MRIITWIATLLALAPAAARAYTADELIDRYIQARGGREKIAAIRSLRITGHATYGEGSSTRQPVVTLVKRPGRVRHERTIQGLTAVTAFDGEEGWSIQPFGGRREPQRLASDQLKGMRLEADIDGPLMDYRSKGYTVEYLGTEDVDGTDAHKLKVTLKDGDVLYVYLDPDYFLEIREVAERKVRGVVQEIETDFGDYELVAGLYMPFSIESGGKGQRRGSKLTVLRIDANVSIDDSLFRFPALRSGGEGEPASGAAEPTPAAEPKPPARSTPAAPGSPPATPAGAAVLVFDQGVLSGIGARNIGSATMSGRISAVAACPTGDGRIEIMVGAASGGVWKSMDGGTTFEPVFDKQPVQSIGAVAIDPQDSRVIWVGTGEAWTRNSVSIGDGIYKSTDEGETWHNVGLPESERIAKIVIHPKRSDTVFACVPGKLWSDSKARGLYRTTDGGASWSLVLPGKNESTGCSSLSLDPGDPDHMLAGMWDFRRKGWTFRSGGDGPNAPSGSGLYRSRDGGATWTELTAERNRGLPPKPWGRVEVEFAPGDRRRVYALIESAASALYVSDDGGETWEERDKSQMMVWRPFYFANLIVDPRDADRVFKTDLRLVVSDDGGRSFNPAGGGHGDWHDLWIDPANTKHVIGGDDGGLWISYDGGNRFWKCDNLPVSQFYHVMLDDRNPYQVYGGLQDNASWAAPSTFPGGIGNAQWDLLDGGDGFWVVPDPTDPDHVYAESQGGYIGSIDRKTRQVRDIKPRAGYKEKLRYNWNAPIAASRNHPGTIYLGAQFLFRSSDRGENWERISPDLTTNDPSRQRQEQSGGVTVDNSSAEMYTTIYSISESPRNGNVIWVGTDDGNVQLTTDGGARWTNTAANLKGLPSGTWVSSVEASRFDPATAYVTIDRHTWGDMAPYAFRTTDGGRTWSRIAGPDQGIRGYAHVLKEDTAKPDLLFLGTEFGLYVSVDGGGRWAEFKGGEFPAVAVRDLAIQPRENDLVIATHGRGIWIVDDILPLRAISGDLLGREAAFLPARPAEQRIDGMGGGWAGGDASFTGPAAPGGAVITYYQRSRHLFGKLTLEIRDSTGAVIDTIPASERRGINRVSWDMRMKPPRVPRAAQVAFGSTEGPRVLPGTYTARLTKNGQVYEEKFELRLDRRATYTVEDRKAQLDAALKVKALFGDMSDLVDRITHLHTRVAAVRRDLPARDGLETGLDTLSSRIDRIRGQIVATKEGGAITGEERIREHADDLYGAVNSYEGRPGQYLLNRIDALRRELEDAAQDFDRLVGTELPKINGQLAKRGLPALEATGKREGVKS